ncbi:MAG: hypothetical protein IIB66_12095 [Proteobacteria bacterium]|nr:hypothetical protein [Pseudomonadota bacterium]
MPFGGRIPPRFLKSFGEQARALAAKQNHADGEAPFGRLLIGFALTEAIALFALVIAFLILFS